MANGNTDPSRVGIRSAGKGLSAGTDNFHQHHKYGPLWHVE